MTVILSIDGACKRNGKPDCLSVGAVFVKPVDGEMEFNHVKAFEFGSTNQRGEMLALMEALSAGLYYLGAGAEDIFLVSDSEYITNCINKEWYKNWQRKGWITAAGEPVKNRDLWERIAYMLERYGDNELTVYHIKGHVFPFGRVAAKDLIKKDPTCHALYNAVRKKFEEVRVTKKDNITHAWELFIRNHGFEPPIESFEEMIVCNMTSDLIAGYYIDILDQEAANRS